MCRLQTPRASSLARPSASGRNSPAPRSSSRPPSGEVSPWLTTSQAEFVRHSLPEIQPRLPKTHTPLPSAPFHGNSAYKSDYTERAVLDQSRNPHPEKASPRSYRERDRDGAKEEWNPIKVATGKSTHDEQYRWHETKPRSPCPPPTAERRTAPLDGKTSHSMDYVKITAPTQPRSSFAPRPAPYVKRPFEGTSTYASEFKDIVGERAVPMLRRDQQTEYKHSCIGVSEMKHEFVKKEERSALRQRDPRDGNDNARAAAILAG